jgi:hypothetical protein
MTYHRVVNGVQVELTPQEIEEHENRIAASEAANSARVRPDKLAELAALRWQKETGGTTFNGMPVATDVLSQTKYIGAVVGAQIDPNAVINWKMADGTFVTLNAQAITAVAMAVWTHVQACFDNEAVLKAQIEAASTAEEIAAVDLNTGWP